MTDSFIPLVVGAGPVGLTMANELVRHGVPCRIIDRAPERSRTSKALAIFPRTLEAFESMGLAEPFLALGHHIQGLSLHHGNQRIAQVEFGSVASPFPFTLGLAQSETERLLTENLAAAGIEVERSLELTGLTQTSDAVHASLRHSDGHEEAFQTPWLLGCDGAHSTTRHLLGMPFEGAPYDESFILADVQIDSDLERDRLHLFLGPEGILGIIPFAPDRWRIVANIAPESRDQTLPDLTLPEVQELVDRRSSPAMRLSDPVWLSRFHISHRKVEQFRRLRVFLVGDSAHIHSPAGGQGMNTGIQDAFNLGWKLALVEKGMAPAQLLGSYDLERRPVASSVINLTDRITRMATVRSSIAQTVRDFLLPVVSGIEFVGEKIADRLAEVNVSYRESSIAENHGAGRIKAGDHAPDADLRDANGNARRLFDIFRTTRHVLLVFLGATPGAGEKAEELAGASHLIPEGSIQSYRIARGLTNEAAELRDISGLAHAAYDLFDGGVVLVRPDGYIAYRSNVIDPVQLQSYLGRIFIAPAAPSFPVSGSS